MKTSLLFTLLIGLTFSLQAQKTDACKTKKMSKIIHYVGEGMDEMEFVLNNLDDGQPLVEVARKLSRINNRSLIKTKTLLELANACGNKQLISETDQLFIIIQEVEARLREGGRTVGAGQVTHILARVVKANLLVDCIRREIQVITGRK